MLKLALASLALAFGIECPSKSKVHLQKSKSTFGDAVKVAIYADVGITSNSQKVMKMTREWGAELSIIPGDFDYQDNPIAFLEMFQSNVGQKAPLLTTVGNHDILKWYEPKYGYKSLFKKHLKSSRLKKQCHGELGIKQYCVVDDMVFVLSGIGTMGSGHEEFIDEVFTKHEHVPWKFCIWHKNQRKLQTGDKNDETGYEVYEICRKHGAMVFTGHEHSYERTHLLSNYENQTISSTENLLELKPGHSFASVVGLGGIEIRGWRGERQSLSHWAATAALDNGVNYGALLCTFQLRGKNTAACEFRDIDGKVWDSFTISTKPGEKVNDIELVTKSKDIPMSSYYSVPMHDGVFTFGKGEHYLLFDVDVPANAQITQAYLQLLLFSTSSVQPPVKMTIEVLGTSPKFIQQTKTKLIQVKAETVVDSGHVWNSPNLASLIQPFASQKVVVVITSDIDYQGAFGFLQSHPILKSCVSPTLFITFQ